jgi:hypothetical protein
LNIPPYLANAKVTKFVLSDQTSFTSLNLGPAIDLNGRDDFISDFKVSPNSTYFTLDSDTYTLNFNLKELLMTANL